MRLLIPALSFLLPAMPALASPPIHTMERSSADRALDLRAVAALYRTCPGLHRDLGLVTSIDVAQQYTIPEWPIARFGWPIYVKVSATYHADLAARSPILGASGDIALFALGGGAHPGVVPP